MSHKVRLIGVLVCAASLSACMSYNPNGYSNYRSYIYEGEPIYPESYDNRGRGFDNYQYQPQTQKQVVVPSSYHVGPYHSPTSHKDKDRSWVNSQNPQGYTIELADDEKPANVARKLYKAPKSDRMAQVKYQRDGINHYKGIYGSYPTMEAAQQALQALPAEVKAGATVKNWGSVQSHVTQ